MIEREILWRLLNGPLGQSVRQIGLADSSLTHVSRAVRWITEHYDQPFRVEDLARSCGMSTSAFHRNFHAVTALSPIQFQKQIRLQKSRLLLLTGARRRRDRRHTAWATTARRSSAASTGGSSGSRRAATRPGSAPRHRQLALAIARLTRCREGAPGRRGSGRARTRTPP